MASMASVPAQSLECAICQELYDEPKQLSCSHTFCQKCLADLLDFNIKGNKLTCPVCRQTTQVKSGASVSKLQTNFSTKSLVEDVKSSEQMCTVCDQGAMSASVAYCQTCGVHMCISCLDAHGKFKLNKNHAVVDSKDIKSGMVKLTQHCKKHPQEEMEWVCLTCNVYICFRCRMLYHRGPNHEVEEVAEIQKAFKYEAKTLQKEADDTVKVIKDHITVVEQENVKSCTMLGERVAQVIRAFEDSLENLTKQKDELVRKLQKCKDEMAGNLQDMKECDLKLLHDISSTRDLITKGAAGFLEGESLVVHQLLCTELQELMSRANCDDEIPKGITKQAESIKFTRYQSQQDLKFGELTLPGMDDKTASANLPTTLKPTHGDIPWILQNVCSLTTLGPEMSDMAPTPDGRMAVCYGKRVLDLFTVNALQDNVFNTDGFTSISFLSDGRCSVIDTFGKFSMYSGKFERVPSPEVPEAHYSKVFAKVTEILISRVVGLGRSTLSMYRPDKREFFLDFHETSQHYDAISRMNRRPFYVGLYSPRAAHVRNNYFDVKVFNDKFEVINEVTVQGSQAAQVVLEDDSILIGWVKEGYVTVDLYTYCLRYVRKVLSHFKLYGKGFRMAAFSTGEMAICDHKCNINL